MLVYMDVSSFESCSESLGGSISIESNLSAPLAESSGRWYGPFLRCFMH